MVDTEFDYGKFILDTNSIYDFILAGNSRFTIHNKSTDGRFTYKVFKASAGPAYYVSVCYGYEKYMYAGFLAKSEKCVVEYKQGCKGKLNSDSNSIRVLIGVIRLAKTERLSDNIEVLHFNECGKCGRELTDPVSIKTGIGPMCAKKLGLKYLRD